ncbi:putative fluconazole resistance protein 1 [Rosellinia necatrix]|uniref:Putative fluconazole resistance protein 1 n=1 Tax=Rosellinia necatrix TaxID=77044 RepID=A0A1W2TN33_ROSNE|nr:putative fluconazole resistance protein 1 [Rosellinia necatrix]
MPSSSSSTTDFELTGDFGQVMASKASTDVEAGRNSLSCLSTQDDLLVDWSGPGDPENPLNWPRKKSFGHVIIVALLSMIVNIAATIVAPGVSGLIEEFQIENETVATLTVTIYLLGFALGPLFISAFSEMYGRLVVYHASNVVFVVFIIACAVSRNTAQYLVFRFISGFAGAAPLTIGGGTIADVIPLQERGLATSLFGLGPLLGPVIGPVVGGFLSAALGWRWTFWLVAILGGAAAVGTLIFMRETHPNTLLGRKAKRLRRDTGNPAFRSKLDKGLKGQQILIASLVRPTQLLIFSPVVLFISIYVALVFGLLYLLFAAFSSLFEDVYGFGTGVSGLSYLGIGVGELVGLVVFGALSDKILKKRMAADGTSTPKPEYRLILMIWFSPIIAGGLFIFGWTAQNHIHWIVPIIGTFFVGYGAFFVILPSQLYLVDLFGSEAAASALGANTLLRSLSGAFLPVAGPALYATLNYGWGNTLLGFLALAFAPAPVFFYKYGEWLRSKTAVKF